VRPFARGSVIAAFSLGAVLIAACGKDEAPVATPAPSAASAPPAATPDPGVEKLRLPVAASAGGSHPEVSDAVLGNGTEATEIPIKAKDPAGAIRQLLRSAP